MLPAMISRESVRPMDNSKLPKVNSTVASLVVAAVAAAGVAVGVEHWRSGQSRVKDTAAAAVELAAPPAVAARMTAPRAGGWVASAPGRVEPRGGEVRLGAQMAGKVGQLAVRMNDNVKAGDLLVRIADDEVMAKLSGAMAEASVRRRERDGEPAVKIIADRRAAEDALSFAERNVFRTRLELDRLQMARTAATPPVDKDIDAARTALSEANDKLETERANYRRVTAVAGLPLPTRLEASLAVARSELAAVESALERTRVRAPADGTVLLVNTRVGETVTPSPEDVLVLFGDISQMQIRAEIEERDVGKIRNGQAVVVRSDAFPGQEFAGTVRRTANALGTPRIVGKGPRRQNDQDVMQVEIDLDGRTPLVSGMRVDAFFRPDATVGATTVQPARAN